MVERGWNRTAQVGPGQLRAFEVNHWGARMGGDTALTGVFRTLCGARPFDLAIMPIGAYNACIRHHSTPEQARQMANEAGAHFVLPVHHQTFPLEPRAAVRAARAPVGGRRLGV